MSTNTILNRINILIEDYSELGRLSPDKLTRGFKLNPDAPDNFFSVDGRVFYKAISRIRVNDIARGDKAKGLDTLSVYKPNEYKLMRCFLGRNNSSGYAIAHGDELVSVFSTQGSSAKALLKDAIKRGARRLDCFALRINGKIKGMLYDIYSSVGFKIDNHKNSGTPGEPYSIINGVSDYVDEHGKVHPEDERVVIFMVYK